jgi:hypothetical protein
MQEPRTDRYGGEDFESWERHHRFQHRSWKEWQRERRDQRFPDQESREYPSAPPVRVSARYTMSINSGQALDPWHGYGADCPDKTPR